MESCLITNLLMILIVGVFLNIVFSFCIQSYFHELKREIRELKDDCRREMRDFHSAWRNRGKE